MRIHILFSAVLVLLLLVVNTARADLVVDTVIAPAECFFGGECFDAIVPPGGARALAQSFPVHHDGLLAAAEFRNIHKHEKVLSEPLFVEIRRTSEPCCDPTELRLSSEVLGMLTIPPDSIDTDPTHLDLTPFGISVTAGDFMAIVFRTDDPSGFWRITAGSPGNSLFGCETILGTCGSLGKAAILTTFVETSAAQIPEPTALLLLGTGLAGLAAWRILTRGVISR